jgi:hypothetical protein
MKLTKLFFVFLICFAAGIGFNSCVTRNHYYPYYNHVEEVKAPPQHHHHHHHITYQQHIPPEPQIIMVAHHNTPPQMIISKGMLPRDALVNFLLHKNSTISRSRAGEIVDLYISEAHFEGVNYEIAFAQMCLHTNYLTFRGRWGGDLTERSNNFHGMRSQHSARVPHNFPSKQIGIRAHIQHLKAYATRELPRHPLVNPRYHIIQQVNDSRGLSRTINGLSGRWSTDPNYANEINGILAQMHNPRLQ